MRSTLVCLLLILPVAALADDATRDADRFLVVDCLLPSQIRQLGSMTYAAARKAIKTSTTECEARGGEYVAYDRASAATTLKVWLPLAEQGDPEAQTYVGEAYEKGFGAKPDYGAAAMWYLRAAEQGYSRAAINLGNLFEQGLGLDKDPEMARFWYRQASKPGSEAGSGERETSGGITLIEPEIGVRGISVLPDPGEQMLVIGSVEGEIPPASVTVNGQPARILRGGTFRTSVMPEDGAIEVVAKNIEGDVISRTFHLAGPGAEAGRNNREATNPQGRGGVEGRYHALIVGNNHYLALPDLDTAVDDARTVAKLLREEYAFHVQLLIDADRYAVLSTLNELRTTLTPEDRLVVYYAGHGELDRANRRGHWLPVDAEPDNPANWISNVSITDMLNVIPANQLIVIADSCYSGMMSRSALQVLGDAFDSDSRSEMLAAMTGARTRTALTSGGVAPVLDSAGGRHSVFAAQLLAALRDNQGAITGLQLFELVAPNVRERSRKVGFDQTPEYAPLKFAGHEAGDFVFLKSDNQENRQ